MNLRFPRRVIFCVFLIVVGWSPVAMADDSPVADVADEPAIGAAQPQTLDPATPEAESRQCDDPKTNPYRKSVAFTLFPRRIAASSSPGRLHQADQQLPALLAEALRNRHNTLTPLQLPHALPSVEQSSERQTAVQAQQLARKHQLQFVVSGEIEDMSLRYPAAAYTPGLYTRVINGIHTHWNSPLDKRDRVFSFRLQLRDGFTGQLLSANHYQTFGKWKSRNPDVGFGSPRFWQSDYGKQIRHLVARAADEMALSIHCQPYIARVDSRPGVQEVVIHSGANSGLRAGDRLELYQLVVQQSLSEYQTFDTRLVRRNTPLLLTEVYPSHSVARISDEVLLSGQYLALSP